MAGAVDDALRGGHVLDVPVATLVLLVPFFFASWLIEYWVSRLFARETDKKTLNRAVLAANLVSYAFLAGVVLIGLAVSIYQH
jgi:hypothetical protein